VNVFDKDPPFVNINTAGYDGANANPRGRTTSLMITKRW
jgi:hypothetical protein